MGEEEGAARRVNVAQRMKLMSLEERRKTKVVNKLKGESSKVLILQADRMCVLPAIHIICKSVEIWKLKEKIVISSVLTGHKKVAESAERIPILKL